MLVLLLLAASLHAEVRLASVFESHMVLQRDTHIAVWGWATAGQEVTVAFAGRSKSVVADRDGCWRVQLEPLAASATPQRMIVSGKGDQTPLNFDDILVGEVWLAAGQSNMEWPMAREAHAQEELPRAEEPTLRLRNMAFAGQYYSAKPFDRAVLDRHTPDRFYAGTWLRCTPESARAFSAVAYYFGKELAQKLRVPVGVINMAVGGSPTEAWISVRSLASDPALRPVVTGDWLETVALDAWCRKRGLENLGPAIKNNAPLPKDDLGPNHPFKPGFLHDAGIAPLIPLPIRGVIWYQGESNASDPARIAQHESLFKLLVADWRKQWGLGDFPFLYCQLSSIGTEKGYHSEHWPRFRDSQRRMLGDIPNCGMAVTSDIGHPTDVHPRNKKEVGHRLALWALARTYVQKIAFSGPLPGGIRRDGRSLVVTFDHAEGGLRTGDGGGPQGFEIAGADGVFHRADVRLEKDRVLLTSPSVAEPVAARYGWRPCSDGNLVNESGLPASTFSLSILETPASRPGTDQADAF